MCANNKMLKAEEFPVSADYDSILEVSYLPKNNFIAFVHTYIYTW